MRENFIESWRCKWKVPEMFIFVSLIHTFRQLLNVHGVIYTAEPLVPQPNSFEAKIAIEKLKRYKSSGTDKIPVEIIQAGGKTLCSEIHRLTDSIWNKKELPQQWKESIVVPIYQKGKN
jgi:hypothetical protein